jgi:hypothetical protein
MREPFPFPLRISATGVLLAVCALSSSALADDSAPAAAGQKEPCVPATNYTLGYDCELFPLPSLAGQPAAGAAAASGAPVAAASAPSSSESSSSSTGPSHAPAYVMLALGAGGAGMTAAFGILALKNKSTLKGECSTNDDCPPSASSTVSALKTDGILADVGLGVALAGVTLGAILFATESGSRSTSGSKHVQPWIGLGAGGMSGTF